MTFAPNAHHADCGGWRRLVRGQPPPVVSARSDPLWFGPVQGIGMRQSPKLGPYEADGKREYPKRKILRSIRAMSKALGAITRNADVRADDFSQPVLRDRLPPAMSVSDRLSLYGCPIPGGASLPHQILGYLQRKWGIKCLNALLWKSRN